MKPLALMLILVSAAAVSQAQVREGTQGEEAGGGVVVLKFSWSKERLNWERDPFGGPIENFDEMRARARNERRLEEAKRAGSPADADRIRREARADAAVIAARRNGRPARYVFMYKASVRNNGPKEIKAIDWDYIFFDAETQQETGRRKFASEEKIAAGKSKELAFTIASPPTQTISADALDSSKERRNLGERVVIVRVEYTDGTSWQPR
jgi:hypothetical protein